MLVLACTFAVVSGYAALREAEVTNSPSVGTKHSIEAAEIEARWLPTTGSPRVSSPASTKPSSPKPVSHVNNRSGGQLVAVLRIPSIGVKVPIHYGVGLDVLADGVGQYPDTSEPGSVGNFGTAGHRCCASNGQPYRAIDKLHVGNLVEVVTEGKLFKYYVVAPKFNCALIEFSNASVLVSPTQVEVLNSVPCATSSSSSNRRLMTLTSCEPGNVVPAPYRIVVWAELRD